MSAQLYETHMHTTLCRHAEGPIEAYAEEAIRRGLRGMIVTCHAPLPEGFSPQVRMQRGEWPAYVELVQRCREAYAGRLDVRLGLESDFMPELIPWLTELHAREPLAYVLGSVHPQTPEYQARYLTGDWVAFHEQYFTSLAEAAECGLFDCLSHPDLVKNYGTECWDLSARMPHILRCLDRIAATGTAMELNTSGLKKRIPEMNPSPTLLRAMRARDIPVVIGADAHEPGRVAGHYEEAMDLLAECGYQQIRIFLDRKPQDIDLRAARAHLQLSACAADV